MMSSYTLGDRVIYQDKIWYIYEIDYNTCMLYNTDAQICCAYYTDLQRL